MVRAPPRFSSNCRFLAVRGSRMHTNLLAASVSSAKELASIRLFLFETKALDVLDFFLALLDGLP